MDIYLLGYGLLVGLFAGVMGGTLAGLAGLGGGLIYVPVFYALMPEGGESISVPVMVSMIAIAMTGFFSTRAHWRLGHIDMTVFKQLFPGLFLGAILGLWSTQRLPEAIVLTGLALLDAWVARDYGRGIRPTDSKGSPTLYGGFIGYASGMLGIGGGTMLVPLLRRSLPLRQAVGTSAMCGASMAAAAVMVNLLLNPEWQTALGHQFPFLVGAWMGILLILPRITRWSAALHAVFAEATIRLTLKALFATLSAGLFVTALWQFVNGSG